MKTGVDYSVHIQVQVVELHAIRVRFRNVNGNKHPIRVLLGLFLHHVRNREWVPIGQPTVERGYAHVNATVSARSDLELRVRELEKDVAFEICVTAAKKVGARLGLGATSCNDVNALTRMAIFLDWGPWHGQMQ